MICFVPHVSVLLLYSVGLIIFMCPHLSLVTPLNVVCVSPFELPVHRCSLVMLVPASFIVFSPGKFISSVILLLYWFDSACFFGPCLCFLVLYGWNLFDLLCTESLCLFCGCSIATCLFGQFALFISCVSASASPLWTLLALSTKLFSGFDLCLSPWICY